MSNQQSEYKNIKVKESKLNYYTKCSPVYYFCINLAKNAVTTKNITHHFWTL